MCSGHHRHHKLRNTISEVACQHTNKPCEHVLDPGDEYDEVMLASGLLHFSTGPVPRQTYPWSPTFACSLGCTRVGNGGAQLGRSFSRQEENPATVLDWTTVPDPEVALSDDIDGIPAPGWMMTSGCGKLVTVVIAGSPCSESWQRGKHTPLWPCGGNYEWHCPVLHS